jgi:hypothetical protein
LWESLVVGSLVGIVVDRVDRMLAGRQGMVALGMVVQGIVEVGIVAVGIVEVGIVEVGIVVEGMIDRGRGKPEESMEEDLRYWVVESLERCKQVSMKAEG